jgi:putative toxin-antitoxin system antitoxin component (TIGR02293 family)
VLSSIRDYQPGSRVSEDIWTSLKLPSRGTELFAHIHRGLPFTILDRIANELQVDRKSVTKAIQVSTAKLRNRAKAGRFNASESDRLIALVIVYQEAIALFEGDAEAANKWMDSPALGLDSKRPLQMLGTRVETAAVLDLIGRLERGVLA